MVRPALEVADIFRQHGSAYRKAHGYLLSSAYRRVMHAIEVCRTAALGSHVDQCDRCGNRRISYNSCRNRHCPKCQSLARAKWLDAHRAQLLPVPYFHVVFTLPHRVSSIALQNKKLVYNILFRAASETLLRIAADSKHLGARIGFLAVLHTWGQNLQHHPHIHCVVPGGGLSPDGRRWVHCRSRFFLSVKVLSRLFRGLFLSYLQEAFDTGKLRFSGTLEALSHPPAFKAFLKSCWETDWVVYSKPPFGGPAQVLDYLGRYTHRVAISNNRLLSLENGTVTFHWKDYRDGNARKIMTVSADEFIRRFLLHVLPGTFVRIRHYGFLANRRRQTNLALCRKLLEIPDDITPPSSQSQATSTTRTTLPSQALTLCPVCRQGTLVCVEIIPPLQTSWSPLALDSS
jgi:hypothetical protein